MSWFWFHLWHVAIAIRKSLSIDLLDDHKAEEKWSSEARIPISSTAGCDTSDSWGKEWSRANFNQVFVDGDFVYVLYGDSSFLSYVPFGYQLVDRHDYDYGLSRRVYLYFFLISDLGCICIHNCKLLKSRLPRQALF